MEAKVKELTKAYVCVQKQEGVFLLVIAKPAGQSGIEVLDGVVISEHLAKQIQRLLEQCR